MEQFSRGQRTALAVGALVLAVIFAAGIVYYTGYAPDHPHFKHDLLFVVLAVGSLIVAWFAWPSRRLPE